MTAIAIPTPVWIAGYEAARSGVDASTVRGRPIEYVEGYYAGIYVNRRMQEAAMYNAAVAELDADLAEVRAGAVPVFHHTEAAMAEIEDERIGGEFSESPYNW